jgi:hypothetical protein
VNDAFRGAVSLVALMAIYYALRVGILYLNGWLSLKNRALLRHKAEHAFWMPASLGTSALLAVITELGAVGSNDPLTDRSWLLLFVVTAAVFGLRPLREHDRKAPKAEVKPKAEATTEKTESRT